MVNTCARCGRPEPDAYVCDRCAAQTAHKLAEIAEVAPAARDTANGLSRSAQGGATGKPGSRLPLDLHAAARMTMTEDRLTRWCRQIAAKRGIAPPWVVTTYGEAIEAACGWLSGQTEWIRHQGPTTDRAWLHVFGWDPVQIDNIDATDPPIIASAFLGYIDDAARVLRSIVRGPADQRYLGPCGAIDPDAIGTHASDGSLAYADDPMPINVQPLMPCDGDVYVRGDARTGRCKTCEAEVDRGDREAWLDGEVREHAFTARDIADAYGINVKTIRSWHERGQLAQHGSDRDGRPLHNVGDVLDLAAADAARRETNRAERARRVAARAAESERVA